MSQVSCKLVEIQDLILASCHIEILLCSIAHRNMPILGRKDKRKLKKTETITIHSLLTYFS